MIFAIVLAIVLVVSLMFFLSEEPPTVSPTRVGDALDAAPYSGKWKQSFLSFSRELIKAALLEEKIPVRSVQKVHNWKNSLSDRQVDAVWAVINPTQLLDPRLLHSVNYFNLGFVLIVPQEFSYDVWNAKGHKIVGVPGFGRVAATSFADRPDVELRLFDDPLLAFADLQRGVLDGVLYPKASAAAYLQTFYRDSLHIVTEPLTEEGVYLVAFDTPRGRRLVDQFNEALQKLQSDGTYTSLLERWGLLPNAH